jgi:four helix bundle protein
MAYQSYKDLKIYELARKLAVEIHEMTIQLPKFEMYEEGSQIRRSSKSVRSNIVEGYGRRRYKAEFEKCLTYALASCDETRDHLDTLYETKSLREKKLYDYFNKEYDLLGRKIRKFMKSVEAGHKPVKKISP